MSIPRSSYTTTVVTRRMFDPDEQFETTHNGKPAMAIGIRCRWTTPTLLKARIKKNGDLYNEVLEGSVGDAINTPIVADTWQLHKERSATLNALVQSLPR